MSAGASSPEPALSDRGRRRLARVEARRLAWPLIAANLGTPLLGLVDTAVVGHLDDPGPLAATALGSGLVAIVYFLFGFLRMGTTALAAQAVGAADPAELRAALVRGVAVAVALGIVLAATAPLTIRAGLVVLAPPEGVAPGFAAYVGLRLTAAPAALALLVVLGWFLGRQDARTPLVVTLATATLNAVLSVVFVAGFGWAERGVAAATALTETAGFAMALLLARGPWRHLGGWPDRARLLAAAPLQTLLRMNRDLFLRSLLLQLAFLLIQALGSRQGEIVLAANAVLMQFFLLAAYALDGFANAAEAMVGRAVGARDPRALDDAVHAAFANGWALAAAVTAAFAVLAVPLIHGLTGIPGIRAAAEAWRWWAVALPLASVAAFVWDGVFLGAARASTLRDGMALALLVLLVGAAVLVPTLGNAGLWAAFVLFLAARGAILAIAWRCCGRAVGLAKPPRAAS